MYHLELNKILIYLHTHKKKKKTTTSTMTKLNKVQYFQNKCGCNRTLVYLYQKNNHPNYGNIINKVQ